MDAKNRLNQIHDLIIDAEKRFKREPHSVELIGVSKKQPIDAITRLHEAGLKKFAENYLQEAVMKIDALRSLDIEWHFIGPIQSNKTKAISEQFDWVHSVDRYKIAHRLDTHRPNTLPPLNILLQVNLNNETSKSGVSIDEIRLLCDKVRALNRLHLRGLMVIPEPLPDFSAQKENFHKMQELFKTLQKPYGLDTLSMGMSNDYIAAISEGSTMVRIGTALFGKRLL